MNTNRRTAQKYTNRTRIQYIITSHHMIPGTQHTSNITTGADINIGHVHLNVTKSPKATIEMIVNQLN